MKRGFRLGDLIPPDLFPRPTSVQRGCFGKVRYQSAGAAEAAIRASLRRADTCRDGPALQYYSCPRCLGWHVGHRKEKP